MTREEAIKKLLECQKSKDRETAHIDADNVLCSLLRQLGFDDVVDEYRKICKWFS